MFICCNDIIIILGSVMLRVLMSCLLLSCMHLFCIGHAAPSQTIIPKGHGVIIDGVFEVVKGLEISNNPYSSVFDHLEQLNQGVFYVYPDMGSMFNFDNPTKPFIVDCPSNPSGKAITANVYLNAKALNNDPRLCLGLSDVVQKIASNYPQSIILPMISGSGETISKDQDVQKAQAKNLATALKYVSLTNLQGIAFDLEGPSVTQEQWTFFETLADNLTGNLKYIAIFDGENLIQDMIDYNTNYNVKFILLRSTYDLDAFSSNLKPRPLKMYHDYIKSFMNSPTYKNPNLNVQFVLPASATSSNFEAAAIFNTKLIQKTFIPPDKIIPEPDRTFDNKTIQPSLKLPVGIQNQTSPWYKYTNPLPIGICNFDNFSSSQKKYNYDSLAYQAHCKLITNYLSGAKNFEYYDFCDKTGIRDPNKLCSPKDLSQSDYFKQALLNYETYAKNSTIPNVLGVTLYTMRPIGFWITTCAKKWFNLDLADNVLLKTCTGVYPEIIRSDVIQLMK